MGKPNILLITTDSQRWDTLSCMGSPFAISPNLDRLAREGVLFEQGHTSSPVCMPARCSLITGLHTPVHGCIENGLNRRPDVVTLPDLLKEHGYYNIMVGKTHFGDIPSSFDVVHNVTEKMIDASDSYAKHLKKHGYNRVSEHPNPVPEHLFMEAFLVDQTIEELKKCTEDKPFFAYCSMVSPHEPVDPPGKWATLYENVTLPEVHYQEGEISNFPEQMKTLLGFAGYEPSKPLSSQVELQDLYEAHGGIYHEGIREKVDELRRLYYGLAAYCDDQVGRLIRFLDESGLRENTLIIFSSDHGLQLFDHGFNDKHNYYDASWRVPFIMSMPGTLPTNERREFALWNDIPTTILGAAGIASDTMQGFDLFTPLKEGKPSPRRCAVATLFKSAALATKRWKLSYYFDKAEGRLFDRQQDPLETNNLYNDPHHVDVRNQLLHALLTWRADMMDLQFYHETGDRFIKRANSLKLKVPVARRVINEVRSIQGWQGEERLNQLAERIDQRYEGGTKDENSISGLGFH
ncbi:sulfatase [Ammoniphilus sp. YIM 78166]|uniref:sulfatase family protein n=1 Tax=Ammoniphilus sp. YIM 78166 TaxID=1644106 RepID=UPI00106F2B20|nr:sulfatase-like hydrolase/transferase [Ammoniphilus sp. YIM 78166]